MQNYNYLCTYCGLYCISAYTVRSKSNCAPGILKQERYPVFEKSITKYFELSILCEEQ